MISQLRRNLAVTILAFVLGLSAVTTLSALRTSSVSAAPVDGLCSGASVDLTSVNDPAACEDADACTGEDSSGNCVKTESSDKISDLITVIINAISVVVGIVAVVFIIIGGFKYITSGGDSGKLGSAKNTIVFALIGLIIVALAQFIVRFVLSKIT